MLLFSSNNSKKKSENLYIIFPILYSTLLIIHKRLIKSKGRGGRDQQILNWEIARVPKVEGTRIYTKIYIFLNIVKLNRIRLGAKSIGNNAISIKIGSIKHDTFVYKIYISGQSGIMI